MAAVLTLASVLTGCDKRNPSSDAGLNLKELDLQDIVYEMSSYQNPVDNKTCSVDVSNEVMAQGKRGVMVGEPCTVTAKDSSVKNNAYYLVDWGDGTWSYNGPVAPGLSAELEHIYKKPGSYEIRAMCIEVETGRKCGFGIVKKVEAIGEEIKTDYINKVEAIGDASADGHDASSILDNDSATYWEAPTEFLSKTEHYVGLRLDNIYRLKTLEVKIPKSCGNFPQALAVEYTTDDGATWYALPKYYYVAPLWKDQKNPQIGLPNPAGATLVFDLDGIVANGIRVTSKLYELGGTKEKYFQVEEMRVTGDKNSLYYSSYGGQFDADLNNMYSIFGAAQTEVRLNGMYGDSKTPFEGAATMMGNTEWYEWDGMKFIWTGYDQEISAYTNRLFNTVVGADTWGNEDGYVWATIHQQKHLNHQNHYDYNSIFIIAARNYLLQRNHKVNFLSIRDQKYNETMKDRLNQAMDYQLNQLDGKNGLLVINDPENDGTASGNGSIYWDAYTGEGYISTYANIYFYASLLAMADIETYQGNAEKAAYYTDLAATVRDNINEKLWDADKGRYIMSIDKNGNKHDFGTTFTNQQAVAYGVATQEQAKQIYAWLDGERIIEGDTSTGEDIYFWKIAARGNTKDIITEGPPYLWETWGEGTAEGIGQLDPRPGGNGAYGRNIQNGGLIFYTSYYDTLGRIRQMGADNAMERFKVIMDEFHIDQLKTRRFNSEGYFALGVICEFPESGIVPLAFQDGIIGLKTQADGLTITPCLPSDMDYAGIREYHFNNRTYSIEVSKKVKEPTIEEKDGVNVVTVPAEGSYMITLKNTVEKA